MKRRFFSIILAMAVSSAQVVAGGFAFACQMDGEIHRACCCTDYVSGGADDAQASPGDCDCCDVAVLKPVAAALTPSVGGYSPPTTTPTLLVVGDRVALNLLRIVPLFLSPDSNAAPDRTRSLFLLNASFRI